MENEQTEVEVVYALDCVWQAIAILSLGLYVGFVCGTGAAFNRIEKVASEGAQITNGNVHIYGNGKPVMVRGFNISMVNSPGPALSIRR